MTIRSVGVVGLGTMGAGIAQVCAHAGFAVVGRELTPELGDAARGRIAGFLARGVEKGRLSGADREAVLARIATTRELGDLAGCDLVIEAVVEELEAKRALFTELERLVRDDTILATNTSALSVTAIAADVAQPERVLGLHFFNPAPVLPLVEVVRAERTSGEVVDAATEFVRTLGKEPVRCRDTPGFVVNRVLVPLLNDCVRTLDETGVSPEELDTAMRAGASWPIGPCALVDLIGVDVQVRASEALWEALREPRMAPPPKLRRMLDAGELGRKTGRGFYSYEERPPSARDTGGPGVCPPDMAGRARARPELPLAPSACPASEGGWHGERVQPGQVRGSVPETWPGGPGRRIRRPGRGLRSRAVTMCARCRRRLLVGERFRFWQRRGSKHPRVLCALCERDAPHKGWIRAARDPGREGEAGNAVRRVA